ncbi:MAG TPA: ShlB/FhaC/HecB family hemolysin secretion/activation protein [Gemmatimonadaceae bacterium]|nr:ShlB/FhaC/HecB family hemolysin secretion/activation protein [Gemmatimonadaceae bacterium]
MLPLLASLLLSAAPLVQSRDTVPSAKTDTTPKKGGRQVSITLRGGGRDTVAVTAAVNDSTAKAARRAARRIPVTPALIASAYATPATRALVLRAREARTAVDSTLRSYQALAYQRMSAGIALRALARERLAARGEQAAKVWWDRDQGALVQITGARAVQFVDDDDDDTRDPSSTEIVELPYVPGEDRLWPVGRWKVDVNDEEIIHPLGPGAEAYYKYSIGDSVVIRIPRGDEYHLIELRVNPRAERWNAVVGSLWLDRESAQLVRAAYRLSSPLDVWIVINEESARDRAAGEKGDDEDIPGWLKPALHPMRASLTAVTQEFALQGGRWWMPISRTAEGLVEVGPMRLPITWEERFTYDAVRGTALPSQAFDSLMTRYAALLPMADSAATLRERHVHGDSAWAGVKQLDSLQDAEKSECLKRMSGRRSEVTRRSGVRTFIVVPCDTALLAHSRDLPPSIFESSDVVFGATDRDELRDWAMSLQAEGGEGQLPPPTILYGLGGGLIRYNRVEGLSLGIRADQRLNHGYSAHALARLGVADLHPNLELGVAHANPRRTWDLTGYHRLAVAGDYGDPFTLGASLGALLFGRDDGFYYRSTGAELTRTSVGESVVRWRLFGEHHSDATVKTNVSLAHLGKGKFPENITAQRGNIGGLGLSVTRTFGLDPRGWRLIADTRGEAAGGSFDYGRALVDLTLSHPLPFGTTGALTGAAGMAGGKPPIQKLFFVGGPQTVRGIDPGSGAGDAFWLGRGELALSRGVVSPVLFGDLGRAGSRDDWQHPGKPLAGAGIGASAFDGLLRADIAKGIRPKGGVRVYLYLDARF